MAKHEDPNGIITSYDSFEEMMEDQRQADEAAFANISPTQRAIPLGGYACNIVHLRDLGPIFGCIQTVEEVVAWHQLYYGIGDAQAAQAVLAERGEFDPPRSEGNTDSWKEDGFASAEDAIEHAVAQHTGSWERGYLFGTWLSNLEPRGELGSAHASLCVPISRESWLDAKAHGGYVSQATAEEISAAMKVVRAEYQAREGTTEGEGDDDSDVSSS